MPSGCLLDRDGTITEEVGYLNHISRFRMLSGAAAAIRRLYEARLPVVAVTNQSGTGRGYFREPHVCQVHGATAFGAGKGRRAGRRGVLLPAPFGGRLH